MPALIVLKQLSYATPDGRPLFEDLNLAFGGERTGLIGRNGIGKSSLLGLIIGELTPVRGTITREGRIGILRQELQVAPGATVADLFGAREGLARIARLSEGRGSLEDAAEADWTLEARMAEALAAVGLVDIEPQRPLGCLSGGQRTRAALAALLFAAPDMLLLDEPTNNLDRQGRAVIAHVLSQWSGGAIMVSHDRQLLREMDRIVEFSTLGTRVYGGNWDHYAALKEAEKAAAERDLAAAEREAREIERRAQAARERQARRASQGRREQMRGGIPRIAVKALSNTSEHTAARNDRLARRQREHAAEALEEARGRLERLRTLKVDLASTGLARGRMVLQLERVTGGPPGIAPVVRRCTLTITGPERIAVTGPNGSGKTTLLRLVMGELEPVEGRVRRPHRRAMLDQQVAVLVPHLSIAENFLRLNPGTDHNACRAVLARFLFRAEAALRPVGDLSGGEKLRAGLACVLGGHAPPELLVLDEPTNHLDLESIAAVEAGLRAYDGALLVASHDEDFLAAIGIERRIEL